MTTAICTCCGRVRESFLVTANDCDVCRTEGARASAPVFELTWADIRARRNRLLLACDWTQLADVPEAVTSAWEPYRAALRDVTEVATIGEVVWPEPPT
jgi:hypothetical protein